MLDIAAGAVMGGISNQMGGNAQMRRQKELNEHGRQQSMQMWNDTNYGAQMKHIKDAGLNAGLLYGQGGAGGATAQAGSGGSAPQAKMMDVGQAAQIGLLNAQKENIESKTKLQNEQSKGQVQTTELTYQQGRGVFMENLVKDFAFGNRGDKDNRGGAHYGDTQIYENSPEGKKILLGPRKIQAELDKLEIEKTAIDAGIKLTEEKAREIYNDILRKWVETGLSAVDVLGLLKAGKLSKGGK